MMFYLEALAFAEQPEPREVTINYADGLYTLAIPPMGVIVASSVDDGETEYSEGGPDATRDN